MKEKLSLLTVLAVLSISLPAQGQPWLGSGTEGDPYLIEDANDMQAIGADPNYWDSHFIMVNDINLAEYTGTQFNIIGNDSNAFTGVFDGNEHAISNFTYSSIGTDNIGLFGDVNGTAGFQAKLKNLRLVDPNVNGWWFVGALSGSVGKAASVSNCSVEGGTVSGCGHVGGLAGYLSGSASDCFSSANVMGGGCDIIGGLIGRSSGGYVDNCYAVGTVSGFFEVGGLVGCNSGGTIENFFSANDVNGIFGIGGLVGDNESGTISNCYSTADVSGDNGVGGLVGQTFITPSWISHCYANGGVSGAESVGGLLGFQLQNNVTYTKCFWDSDVNPDVNGIGNTSDSNVIGESTANMQTRSTFTDVGWDFVGEVINGPNDIWRMCVDDVNYPLLSWQFNEVDFICPDGVDLLDFSVLGLAWGSEQGDGNWNKACDISDPNDDMINMKDLDAFTNNWLAGVE